MFIDTIFNKKDQVIFLWSNTVRHGTVNGVDASLRFHGRPPGQRRIQYLVDTPDEFSNPEAYMVAEDRLFENSEANINMLESRIITDCMDFEDAVTKIA